MKKVAKYGKAPIIEAIIDIRVPIFSGSLLKVVKVLEKDYPKKENIREETFKVHSSNTSLVSSSTRQDVGYKLTSDDGKYVVQIKNNGFTFSIIKDYDDWSAFIKIAKNLWKIYCKEVKPSVVNRVAARYINRIDIPHSQFEIQDYFETYPRVLENNEGLLSNFFLQVQLPQKEGGVAIVNQTIAKPIRPEYTSVLLDIDVFHLKEFSPKGEDLWKRMKLLREQKNNIFEKSITDKSRKLFV